MFDPDAPSVSMVGHHLMVGDVFKIPSDVTAWKVIRLPKNRKDRYDTYRVRFVHSFVGSHVDPDLEIELGVGTLRLEVWRESLIPVPSDSEVDAARLALEELSRV